MYAALKPAPGDRILDLGCGPGFYVAELLDRVGPEGSVVGVDPSAEMLAFARRRSQGRANVDFREGEATAVPVDDSEFDAALSVQVLEYVPEVDRALAELHRALRPGGRVVVWDVDWSTLSWHSADPERMQRALRAWDGHLAHPAVPRTLAAGLRRAGFSDVSVDGIAFVGEDLSPEGYVGAIFPILEQYLSRSGQMPADEVEAWAAEQRELSERGEFFFACLQFCFAATKPRA